MQAAVITPELVQRNLKRLVAESPMRLQAIAVVAQMSQDTLAKKLESDTCTFSVAEVASITMALGYKIEVVFEELAEQRDCFNADCVEPSHEWVYGDQQTHCRLERIEGQGFTVHGHLQDDGWVAWVDADELDDGHLGIAQARDLTRAFEAMQARCDELNAKESN